MMTVVLALPKDNRNRGDKSKKGILGNDT